MLGLQENFVSERIVKDAIFPLLYRSPSAPHICWDSRNEANLENIIIISGEGELSLVGGLPVDKVLPLGVCDHHVNLQRIKKVNKK